jgi:lipopolysaccharide/colanic/teichoic acid biosynthesis glycosyltransferase
MIELDINYAQRLSLWRDVAILASTFPVLFQQVLEMVRKKRKRRGTQR